MANLSALQSAIQGIQSTDPRLYNVLSVLASEVETLKNPIPEPPSLDFVEGVNKPPVPTEYTVEFTNTHILINWDNPDEVAIDLFDVREGDDWETATRVALIPTSFLTLNPTNVGEHTYLIGSRGPGGESVAQLQVQFTIPALGYLVITPSVLDNFVRLSWTIPTSTFAIDYYNVEREGIVLGRIPATFVTHFENTAGEVTYSISPVDIAGNIGPKITEDVIVRSPIDFELQESRSLEQATSVLTNVYEENDGSFLAPVPIETWNQHFSRNSAASIQDLIDDGYNIWAQPNDSPGSAVLNFTIPNALNDVIVEMHWATREIVPSVVVTASLTASGTTYSGQSIFLNTLPTSFSVTLTFTATGQGIVQLLGFMINVILKKAQDSGTSSTSSGHSSGTLVSFTRDYLEAPDVAVVVKDTGSFYATISNVTTDDFRVRVFDENGNRASKNIDWLARGII